MDLDTTSEAQLERLHAGLVKLASMDDTVLEHLCSRSLALIEAEESALRKVVDVLTVAVQDAFTAAAFGEEFGMPDKRSRR